MKFHIEDMWIIWTTIIIEPWNDLDPYLQGHITGYGDTVNTSRSLKFTCFYGMTNQAI